MMLYVCHFLLAGLLSGSLLQSAAAPASVDQRQDGKYNVHAKFENFLIVVATSGSSDLLTNLATQALELKDLASQPAFKDDSEEPSESVVYETDVGNRGREPYHVEIVRIEKEGEGNARSKPEKLGKAEDESVGKPGEIAKTAESPGEKDEPTGAVADGKEEKKSRSLWRNVASRELVEKKEQEKLEEAQENLPAKDEPSKARPGTSLKKQLSKKEHEDASLTSGERNDVGSSESKPEELKLLGDSIENCGPGRYRDNLGVCQFDKNFN